MSISIGTSPANGLMARRQTTLEAVRAAEEMKKREDARSSLATSATAPLKGRDEAASPWPRRDASSDGPRVEVDRRTEDSKAVKVTVISYSDGSTESVTLTKVDELLAQAARQLSKQVSAASRTADQLKSMLDRGMFIDRDA